MSIKKLKNLRSGFSLIEALVAISLSLVILTVIYDVFLFSRKMNLFGSDQLELVQNGRIALERLTREIRQTPDIVSELPATKDDPLFPPPDQIEFQDGHNINDIQYLRYYLDNDFLVRQIKVYYFPSDPGQYVYFYDRDAFNNLPQTNVLEEKTIAEFITDIDFYGTNLIQTDLRLAKNKTVEHFYTVIWGRNTR